MNTENKSKIKVKFMNSIKAAFFDRDGTLIKDVCYLSSLDQIEIIPQAVVLAKTLQDSGYKLFVVTNQSGVARGFFDEEFVKTTHKELKKLFEIQGVYFEKMYFCPHHPDAKIEKYKKKCLCRKPETGMILGAASEFNIDLSKSLMFGDKDCDIKSGHSAGCRSFFVQDIYEGDKKVTENLKTLGIL